MNLVRFSKQFYSVVKRGINVVRWEAVLFGIAAFIGFLWFRPSFSYDVVGRGDFLSPYGLSTYFFHRLNAYDINKLFGSPSSTHLAHIFTYLGFFYVFEKIGFSATFSTGLFFYTIIFLSSISFYSFIRKFSLNHVLKEETVSTRLLLSLCSILFSYSPVVISLLIPGHTVLLIAYASFPFLLGVLEDINSNKDNLFTYYLVFVIYFIIAPSFSNLGVFLVHHLGLFMYAVVTHICLSKQKNIVVKIKKYLLFTISVIMANLWWLLPTLANISNKIVRAASFSTINNFAPTSPLYSISNMFLLKPYGIMHVDHSLVFIHNTLVYRLIAAIIFLTPIFVFIQYKNMKYRKVVIPLLVIVLMGIYISKGYNPPFASLFAWLYENITVFRLFRRSVSKFYWLVYVFQMTLFSLSLIVVWLENKGLRKYVLYFISLATLFHLYNYNRMYPAIYYFDIPQYFHTTNTYFEDFEYKYVYIPHNYMTQPTFSDKLNNYSGRDLIDYIWDFRYVRPDITGEYIPNFSQKEESNNLYLKIHDKEILNEDICALSKNMGLTHMVVRKNLMNADVAPEVTLSKLNRLDVFDDVKEIGEDDDLVVLKLKESCTSRFIYSEATNLVVEDSFNESFYLLDIENEGSADINLMVNYDKNWKLVAAEESVKKSKSLILSDLLLRDLQKEGVSGEDQTYIRWNILNSGTKYFIYYAPQLYFYLGLVITFATFLLFSIVIVVMNIKSGVLYRFIKKLYNYYQLFLWNVVIGMSDKKPAPHLKKQALIKSVQKKTGIKTFIETGTYKGEMTASVSNLFSKMYTIEIDKDLHSAAKKRFSDQKKISVLLGDSGEILPNILKDLDEDIILWFDAHYSGGVTGQGEKSTPIEKELTSIFEYEKKKGRKCIILIDDARCFIGKNSYPTLSKVEKLAKKHNKTYEEKDDIIRLYPLR